MAHLDNNMPLCGVGTGIGYLTSQRGVCVRERVKVVIVNYFPGLKEAYSCNGF